MVYRVHMAADMSGSPIRGMGVRRTGMISASQARQWVRTLIAILCFDGQGGSWSVLGVRSTQCLILDAVGHNVSLCLMIC